MFSYSIISLRNYLADKLIKGKVGIMYHGQPTAARSRVNCNRTNPQGVRQPKASTAEHPNNVNRQNRNIENQPQRESASQPHPQKSMQRQERMEHPHQQQRAQRSEKREQGKEKMDKKIFKIIFLNFLIKQKSHQSGRFFVIHLSVKI